MNTKTIVVLGTVALVASCAPPLETMQPPEWAKSVPLSTGAWVVVTEPEPKTVYVETHDGDAEFLLDLEVKSAGANQPVRYSIPMKRQVVLGNQSLPSLHIIADGWGPEGFTGAFHFSYQLLEVSNEAARVAVDTWWTDREHGEGGCVGELTIPLGHSVHRAYKGGCEVIGHFHRPDERSNHPLQPTAGSRGGVISPGTCVRRG